MDRERARARLESARVYLVTDGRDGGAELHDFLEDVLSSGVDVLQLREKEQEPAAILKTATVFRRACDRFGIPFIMNDRADLALAARADGVHLGQDDLPLDTARQILGPDAIIGRSTHDAKQLRVALREDVDYIAVGPVYETPTKPGRPATGLDLIRLAAAEAALPWFAIGGIDPGNIGTIRAAGASRVVVVRAIAQATEPGDAVRGLRKGLE